MTKNITLFLLSFLFIITSINSDCFGSPSTGEDRYLNELLTLSIRKAKKYGNIQSDWKGVIKQSLSKKNEIIRYSSKRTIYTHEGRRSDLYMSHRIDFNKPNRFFVTQSAQDKTIGMLYDQWVTIGRNNYQNAGLWSKTQDIENDVINQSLRYQNYIEIIRTNKPVYYVSYRSQGRNYLLLEYKSPINIKSNTFIGDVFKDCNASLNTTCRVDIWIDLKTYVISKASIIYSENQQPSFSIKQAFACFNEKINVKPPPWLNIGPNSKGEIIITNDRIAVLNHYECKRK